MVVVSVFVFIAVVVIFVAIVFVIGVIVVVAVVVVKCGTDKIAKRNPINIIFFFWLIWC